MPDPLVLVDLMTGAGAPRPRADRGESAPNTENRFPCFDFSVDAASGGGEAGPIYSASDLQAAVDEARRSAAVEVEARTREALLADLSHRQAEALEAIAARLRENQESMAAWLTGCSALGHRLAVMLARAIVPRALERQPLADIGDMLHQTVSRLVDLPAIELRLHPDLVEAGGELLDHVVEATGYRGVVDLLGDPSLRPGDAQLTWKGGVAQRDVAGLEEEVAALVDRWLPAEAPQDIPASDHPSIEDRSMP